MKLGDLLVIPYIRSSEAVEAPENSPGGDRWIRRFSYPELPSCVVEAMSTLDGLLRLEHVRVATILELVAAGRPVPVPRAPLRSADVAADLALLDVEIPRELLDSEASAVAGLAELTEIADGLRRHP